MSNRPPSQHQPHPALPSLRHTHPGDPAAKFADVNFNPVALQGQSKSLGRRVHSQAGREGLRAARDEHDTVVEPPNPDRLPEQQPHQLAQRPLLCYLVGLPPPRLQGVQLVHLARGRRRRPRHRRWRHVWRPLHELGGPQRRAQAARTAAGGGPLHGREGRDRAVEGARRGRRGGGRRAGNGAGPDDGPAVLGRAHRARRADTRQVPGKLLHCFFFVLRPVSLAESTARGSPPHARHRISVALFIPS